MEELFLTNQFQVENCPPEKLSEATRENSRLASELCESSQLIKNISDEKSSLAIEVESLKAQLLEANKLHMEVDNQLKDIKEKYHSTKEVSCMIRQFFFANK